LTTTPNMTYDPNMNQLIKIQKFTKFGKWTVLGSPKKNGHSTYWKCKCDCGTIQTVNGYTLRMGTSSQCTKCKIWITLRCPEVREKARQTLLKKWGNKAAGNKIFNNYKATSKKKNRSFLLSREHFDILISNNCHYCNKSPSAISKTWKERHGTLKYTGIDRKDNSIGYEINNCVPCCSRCNRAKLQMPYEEFKQWIRSVAIHFGGLHGN
jgi:hypothetical protein